MRVCVVFSRGRGFVPFGLRFRRWFGVLHFLATLRVSAAPLLVQDGAQAVDPGVC